MYILRKKTVLQHKKIFEKRFEDNFVRDLELEKMRLGQTIGEHGEHFVVPTVTSVKDRSIFMERIDPIKSLRFVRGNTDEQLQLFSAAGSSLANIHKKLCLPKNLETYLPQILNCSGEQVFIHGDYTKTNLCTTYSNKKSELVILDWQMTALLGGKATIGTPYYDVMWFVSGLYLEPDIMPYRFWNVDVKSTIFLDSYFRKSSASSEGFKSYCYQMFDYRYAFIKNHPKVLKRSIYYKGLDKLKSFLDARLI